MNSPPSQVAGPLAVIIRTMRKIKFQTLIVSFFIAIQFGLTTKSYSEDKPKFCSLKISVDNSISFRLIRDVELLLNSENFKTERDIDSITKMFTLSWKKLLPGTYNLKLKTVFNDLKEYKISISNDTSFTLQNFYDLLDLKQSNPYSNVEKIKIYYKSDGCFHNYKEQISIERVSDKIYSCTLIQDSIAFKDTMGRNIVLEIPIYKKRQTDNSILQKLFDLVSTSNILQDSVIQNGGNCFSTTHKKLFVLCNNNLFQFSDNGVCEWKLYNIFKELYFKKE